MNKLLIFLLFIALIIAIIYTRPRHVKFNEVRYERYFDKDSDWYEDGIGVL